MSSTGRHLYQHLHICDIISYFSDDSAPEVRFIGILPQRARIIPPFRWVSNEAATFECSLDGQAYRICGEGFTGTWSRQEITSGRHVFRVRARDSLGNVGEPISHVILVGRWYSVVLLGTRHLICWAQKSCPTSLICVLNPISDTTAPKIELLKPLPSKSKEATSTFSWTADEDARFTCAVDDLKNVVDCGRGKSGRFTTPPLEDGRHVFYLLGEDELGNTARPRTHRWTVGESVCILVKSVNSMPRSDGAAVMHWAVLFCFWACVSLRLGFCKRLCLLELVILIRTSDKKTMREQFATRETAKTLEVTSCITNFSLIILNV